MLNLLTIAENLIAAAVGVLSQLHPDIVMQLEVEDQPNIFWAALSVWLLQEYPAVFPGMHRPIYNLKGLQEVICHRTIKN